MKVVMMGATGAVGQHVVSTLLQSKKLEKLTLLGRRPLQEASDSRAEQHTINIFEPQSYVHHLAHHTIAICTLGVGQPSKVSKEEFLRVDKQAVLDFAKASKNAGIEHFELLSSVGISTNSASFYLKTKAELVDEIAALNFRRFSVFQPSMILTPTNRYGVSQAIILKVWPWLHPLLIGKFRKFRGIEVALLGRAIAQNVSLDASGIEYLTWDDFKAILK